MAGVASVSRRRGSPTGTHRVGDTSPNRLPRRKVVVLGISVVVAGLALGGGPLATAAANHLAASAVSQCAQLHGASVSLGSWPTVLRAATGQLHGVTVRAKELDLGDFQIHNFQMSADHVNFSKLGALSGHPSVDIEGGTAVITTTTEDLSAYLQRKGVPATVQASPGGFTLNGNAGLVSWTLPLIVSVQNGALVVAPSLGTGLIPTLVSDLFRGSIAIRGVWISSVRELPDALQVTASFSGNPASLGCSAHVAVG